MSLDIPNYKNTKKVLGRVTKEQLLEFLTPVKDNWEIIRKRPQLYQFLAAFIDLMENPYVLMINII